MLIWKITASMAG